MWRFSRGQLLIGGWLLIILLVLFLRPQRSKTTGVSSSETNRPIAGDSLPSIDEPRQLQRRLSSAAALAPTPEEVVTNKINQFARNRREIVYPMARQLKVTVPDEVERFFEAVEAGWWDEVEGRAKALRENLGRPEQIKIWPAIHETWGAVQEARNWPAQKLLDYGNAILGSLRPGMVYVGGTDPGRWIPTMLNETSEGERHVVLTQNASRTAPTSIISASSTAIALPPWVTMNRNGPFRITSRMLRNVWHTTNNFPTSRSKSDRANRSRALRAAFRFQGRLR